MELERYRNYLKEEDKSEKTLNGYITGVKLFIEWFTQANGREPKPGDITSIDLREFRQYLMHTKNRSVGTVNYRLAAMRKYLHFANEQGFLPTGLPALPKEVKSTKSKTAPKSLTKKQQDELLKVVERGGNLRDKTIITLLLHTGLRNSELRSLQLSEIELLPRGGWLSVYGKGGKFRKIPLNNEVRRVLGDYMERIAGEATSRLFNSKRGPKAGSGLSDVAVQQLFNRYKDQVPGLRDNKDITVHSLRHTFATRMLEAGRNLVEVQALLGHENINTTAIYTKPHPDSLIAAVDSLCDR